MTEQQLTIPTRGRFAPSPTGPLHFGSLIAAVGSCLQARRRGGQWLVRMEDLDKPREVAGAADDILRTLERFGMAWDGPVMYQSQREEAYQAALQRLMANDAVYPCGCSRKEIAAQGRPGPEGIIYPGICRHGLPPGKTARAIRLHAQGHTLAFVDQLQGACEQDLEKEVGDFIIRRADGLFAYQLAVVVDDAEQGITEVVRGTDLLLSTPRQILLQRLLNLPTPDYLHLPIAVNEQGEKLSKQTGASAVDTDHPVPELVKVMMALDHTPPRGLHKASVKEFWEWALSAWDPAALPRQRELRLAADLRF